MLSRPITLPGERPLQLPLLPAVDRPARPVDNLALERPPLNGLRSGRLVARPRTRKGGWCTPHEKLSPSAFASACVVLPAPPLRSLEALLTLPSREILPFQSQWPASTAPIPPRFSSRQQQLALVDASPLPVVAPIGARRQRRPPSTPSPQGRPRGEPPPGPRGRQPMAPSGASERRPGARTDAKGGGLTWTRA